MKKTIPTQKLILTALFAALTAAGVFVRIPTPWMPFTLQVLFVFLSGSLLGPRYGALAQGVYVALGLLGLPIFTSGGGIGSVLSPSFGIALSWPASAAVVGVICGREARPSFRRILIACLAGMFVYYAIGLPYMGLIMKLYLGQDIGLWDLLWRGMIMFLPFDILKAILAALLSRRLIPAVRRGR